MEKKIEYSEINAKKAMEENNIPLAIGIYKKLCEEDKFNNQTLLARYGLALRKEDKSKEFIEICREYIKTKKINAEFLNNVLCWCIYDEYIKKYNEDDSENFDEFLKEAQYICNNTTQLPAKEHFKNPYVLTVEKVVKVYNNRNNTNYNEILKWIELLNPDMLSSEDAYIFIDKDGKDREKASHKEFYYQNKIKALEKTYQYELCYKLCEECFEKIENLHYKNEIWIESRKLYCKCMMDSQYIDEYIKFAEEKKLWHIYAKVSEICFRYNKLEEATIYGCKSILCSFEFQRMVKLYLTMGQLFENIGQSANAKIMYHAAAYYRNENLWNIPQELEYAIEKYDIDMTIKINRRDIEKIARNYLINKKIIRIGQITKIIQEKRCGFIKINDENDTIYFKIKDIKDGFAEKNKYAEFEIIEYEDKKRAINIKVIRGGKPNGSIC